MNWAIDFEDHKTVVQILPLFCLRPFCGLHVELHQGIWLVWNFMDFQVHNMPIYKQPIPSEALEWLETLRWIFVSLSKQIMSGKVTSENSDRLLLQLFTKAGVAKIPSSVLNNSAITVFMFSLSPSETFGSFILRALNANSANSAFLFALPSQDDWIPLSCNKVRSQGNFWRWK